MGHSVKAGLLRISKRNPRYFEEVETGKIVYLTGSHTWNNFQDGGEDEDGDGRPDYIRSAGNGMRGGFDYAGYLDFLERHEHNFIRMWMSEHTRWSASRVADNHWVYPQPYARSGPGTARDGLAKFDLGRFDPVFFARLRERVALAAERGIYVGVMLFGGASLGNKRWPGEPGKDKGNPWHGHPFHRDNNINGIDGDTDGDDQGWDTHQLKDPAVLDVQKSYIRRVIDELNDYDNVLYEISNEDPFNSYLWHYEIIRSIKAYEAGKPKQHPVGMTIAWSMDNERLLESPADWISPSHWEHDLTRNPATYDGNANHPAGPKVMITDTDHVFFGPTTMDFTWKAFCRGHNIVSMEHSRSFLEPGAVDLSDLLRNNGFMTLPADRYQTDTKRFADRIDLASAVPQDGLSSTGYCLAQPGAEYLVYQPEAGPFQLDLSAGDGVSFEAEWFNPDSSEHVDGGKLVIDGGGIKQFESPITGPAVLYLRRCSPQS